MAGSRGGPFPDLTTNLLKEGHAFSFYQVIRLLRLLGKSVESTRELGSMGADAIRVRPSLSLAFPPADVETIEKLDDSEEPHFLVTATPLGLYGPSSPLPTFYTEDLIDEAAADESVTRDFVDIINHRLFWLLFRSWTKYRQLVQVSEERNPEYLERLFSLVGLGERVLQEEVPEAFRLLRYIGLFTQFPGSAAGLKALLQDAVGGMPVDVMPCIQRNAKIPEDQRLSLGGSESVLGRDSYIGEEIEDRMGKFRLLLGPVNRDQFQSLLPGGKGYSTLLRLTRLYVTDALEYDIELTLAQGQAKSACLGMPEWSRLGWDTWVFSGELREEVRTSFQPQNL
jgi:type VI secretion system protein ImpH